MQILIIEDEELAAKKLKKTLAELNPDIVVAGVTDSIGTSVAWLQNNPAPDLILMDIELADGQSFEIFNQIEVTSPVVFTTSYDESAMKAFKVNSMDYLLKPIQREELQAALDKFSNAQAPAKVEAKMDKFIHDLHRKMQPAHAYRNQFLAKQGQKLVSVSADDIAYFYSDGRINFIKTTDNRRMILEYTSNELEEMLDPDQFFRINGAFYVSRPAVEKTNDYFGNRLLLSLKPQNDVEALVSREKVADFKKWMNGE